MRFVKYQQRTFFEAILAKENEDDIADHEHRTGQELQGRFEMLVEYAGSPS